MVDLGLFKSGKLELWRTIDQGNLRQLLGIYCKKMPLIVKNIFSTEMRIPKVRREMIHDDSEIFVMGSDAAEFVNKVKDQVRNRQKRLSNVAESGEEHSIIWGMFMTTTSNAATFMGKNFSTFQSVVKNCGDLTLKQMFDVTAQLVNNQDEINGLDKIQWEKYSWTRLSLIGDETVISLQRAKVYVFSDSVLCLGRILQHLAKHGKTGLQGSNPWKATETMMVSVESRYVQWHLLWQKATKMNVWHMPESSKYLREDLGNGHLLGQVLKRSGILEKRIVHKEFGIILRKIVLGIRRKRTSYFPCNDSRCQLKKQRTWTTVDTLHCRSRHSWYNLSHYSFCQSAQCLRSSGSDMRRIWEPSRWIGGTWDINGSINCSWWSQSRNSCPRWSSQEWPNYLAAIHSTSRIAFTRKQTE